MADSFDAVWDSIEVAPASEAAPAVADSFDAMWDSIPETQAEVPASDPSFLSSVLQDVKETPAALWGAVSSIPSGIKNVASIPYDVVTGNYDRLERTARGAGKLGAGIAGAGAGAILGPAGMVGGGAAGITAFDKLLQWAGVDPETTPEEDLANLRKNTVQGAVTAGAAKVLAPAAKALGTKLESTAKAMDRKSLGARASDYGKAADFRTIETPEGAITKARADIDAVLEEGKLGASRDPSKLLTKLNETTDILGAKVGEAIKEFDATKTEPVRPTFDSAIEYLYSGKAPADLLPSYLDRLVKIEEGIRREGGGSLEYVQRLKTALGKSWDPADQVKSGFDRALYRDLQTTIESKVPVVKQLNQEISKYRTVEPIVIRELKKSENVSPLSQLRDVVYTTGGIGAPTIAGSVLGGPAGAAVGAGLGLAGKAIASPKGQATIAKAVRNISKTAPANKDVVALVQALTAAKSAEKKDFARVFKREKGKETPAMKKDIKAVEAEIDADPYYSTLYEIESGRNPKAKNPDSSASGGFQLIKSTAKSLGVEDPFDLKQAFKGAKKLTEEHARKFKTNDPVALYSLHYLGEDVYRRWQAGKPLNKDERAQVAYLNEKVLPKFKRVYASKVELA